MLDERYVLGTYLGGYGMDEGVDLAIDDVGAL
jgi:hypothetical protein